MGKPADSPSVRKRKPLKNLFCGVSKSGLNEKRKTATAKVEIKVR